MPSSTDIAAAVGEIVPECDDGAHVDGPRFVLRPGAWLRLPLDAAPGCHALTVTLARPAALRLELLTGEGPIPLPLARTVTGAGTGFRTLFRLDEEVAFARLAPVEGESLEDVRVHLETVTAWRSLLPDWPLGPVALPPGVEDAADPVSHDPPLRPPGWSSRIGVAASQALTVEGTLIAARPAAALALAFEPPLAPGRHRLTGRFLDAAGRPQGVEPRVLVPGEARDPLAGPHFTPLADGRAEAVVTLKTTTHTLVLRPRATAGTVDVRDLAVLPEGRIGSVVRRFLRGRVTLAPRPVQPRGETLAITQARPAIPAELPAASIIVATRDAPRHLSRFLATVGAGPSLPFELVLVDNGTTDREALALLEDAGRRPHVRVIADPRPFNFAALANAGARATRADVLVFANNDLQFPARDWLGPLVRAARDRRVGVAGARLLYPDGRIQHDGLTLAGEARIEHLARFVRPSRVPAPCEGAARTVTAVTGALMAVRAELFALLGGFDCERFGVLYNDVDLCLRAARAGHVNVIPGGPPVVHHESATIGPPRRDALFARGGQIWRLARAVEAERFAEVLGTAGLAATVREGAPPPWPASKPGVSQAGSSEDPPASVGA